MRWILASLLAVAVNAPSILAFGRSDLQKPLGSGVQSLSEETKSLLDLHKKLVEIESISSNENALGHFVADFLSSKGFSIHKQPVELTSDESDSKSSFNVYAYLGKSPDSHVLVSSHLDTVPPFYNYSFDPTTFDIKGRGTVDDKGSMAAQITAVLSLLEAKEIGAGDVAMLFVVSEEDGGWGMKAASDLDIPWKVGIFGEPTENKLAAGHKGIIGLKVKAYGKASHSGYPWLGIDANAKLIRALATLQDLDLGYSEKYGNTTINIGRVDAGAAANVVSAYGLANVAIRLAVDGPEKAMKKIQDALGDSVELDFGTSYGPVNCDTDVDGFEVITVNYGTDVPNLYSDSLEKRYLYGPGSIFVAHSDHEQLNVRDLEEAVRGYKKLIKHALKA